MEVFVLLFWFATAGFIVAAIAKLWLENAEPGSGRLRLR